MSNSRATTWSASANRRPPSSRRTSTTRRADSCSRCSERRASSRRQNTSSRRSRSTRPTLSLTPAWGVPSGSATSLVPGRRSEEHTSELQSLTNLVCRLLLEKKKKTTFILTSSYYKIKHLQCIHYEQSHTDSAI